MDINSKISIVMICYNHEKYIGEAINSILSQTYSDFELIIVDDGSKDNTLKIIREYDDSRIIVVEQENSGPSIALNTGINKSRGQFIAFMSGDDVSFPNRLETQIEQIESQQADMIFCLPQIIGPDSNILDNSICHVFFDRNFETTADLYRELFYFGNFLCAPTCFCRRTAIEKIGRYKRGLIQLQDFDYLIRACKKELVVKLHKDPLLQYRYLFGANLSDSQNTDRILLETATMYRSYFDEAPIDLLHKAFGEKITLDALDACPDIEIDKSFLFLEHSIPTIKEIGIERIILQFEDDRIYEKLRTEREFDTTKLFKLAKAGNMDVINFVGQIRKGLKFIRNFFLRYLPLLITEGPRWTEAQVEQRIGYYLEHGDRKRAIMMAHGYKRIPPGPTIFAVILNLFDRIIVKLRTYLHACFDRERTLLRAFLRKIRSSHLPLPVLEDVFTLSRIYDYSRENNYIAHEDPPERIYLNKPNVLGNIKSELFEGEACALRGYVSIINHAVITGGSSLVLSQTGDLLSDEMVDFPTKDFGIKSPHISYRYKNKVILSYRKKTNTRIKEGILLSCDHDNNYFHWLVECLPKLVFIDDLKQFKEVPLLIPHGLHENLLAALTRVNINHHPIINLSPGIAYRVDRLVFPSNLSRVIDRYKGPPVFDKDIILSQKWIARVADILKSDAQLCKKPWRKLYLARRKGFRALVNQPEIERLMTEHNFEIVESDHVSLNHQIELFSQASVIVAPTGAALTNMLFCQPGTKVIILMSNHETTNFSFWTNLGNIAGLDVEIIAGERLFNLTNYYSVHDDYVVDPNILLGELRPLVDMEG